MTKGNQVQGKNNALKYVALATPVLVFLLLVGAFLFYKERMLYIDAPHVLFRIINDGHFWIEERRYGSFISQVLPLLGSKLHLPLQSLMMLYSAGFYLFYLVVSLLLVFRFRNYGLAILMGLYFTLFVSESYYWSNNEVHQGIGWLLIVMAVNFSFVTARRNTVLTALLFVCSYFLAIWTHPLVMLAAVYLWFFYMAGDSWPYSRTQTIIFSAILLALSATKFYQGMHHGYDSSKIDAIRFFQYQKIKTITSSPQLHFFIKSCITRYQFFSLLFIAGIIGLIKEKKYLLLLWTILFVTGYLVLTCITFWDVTSRSYMECEYMPLVIICCAPFVYYVLPKMNIKLGVSLIALMYIFRLAVIFNAAVPFTNRVAIMENIYTKMKIKNITKVIIPEPIPGTDSALLSNWSAPAEGLYISKLHDETPQRTLIFLRPDELRPNDTIMKDTLLGCFERRSASLLNSYYFQMDTTTTYKIISYGSLME